MVSVNVMGRYLQFFSKLLAMPFPSETSSAAPMSIFFSFLSSVCSAIISIHLEMVTPDLRMIANCEHITESALGFILPPPTSMVRIPVFSLTGVSLVIMGQVALIFCTAAYSSTAWITPLTSTPSAVTAL